MQKRVLRMSPRCARIAEEPRRKRASSTTQLFAHLAEKKQEYPSSPTMTALYIAASALQSRDRVDSFKPKTTIGGESSADFSFGVEMGEEMAYNRINV